MKKITFLLLITLFAISCSDDDKAAADENFKYQDLFGRWKVINSSYAENANINTSDCMVQNEQGIYWTFLIDINGEFKIIETCTNNATGLKGTYKYSDDILTLDFSGNGLDQLDDIHFQVQNDGKDKLSFKMEEEVSTDWPRIYFNVERQ